MRALDSELCCMEWTANTMKEKKRDNSKDRILKNEFRFNQTEMFCSFNIKYNVSCITNYIISIV